MTGLKETWSSYRSSIGDRSPLFAMLAEQWGIRNALYPGCYLDLSPSTAIDAVTYVDVDDRAARCFAAPGIMAAELGSRRASCARVEFLHLDYTLPLPLPAEHFDLVISLYAGPVWDHCASHLAPGGLLLANASHGDASLAALDPALELVAAVQHRDGRYRLDTERLDTYLVPKASVSPNAESIRRSGRGITYTKPAFAYVFRSRDR